MVAPDGLTPRIHLASNPDIAAAATNPLIDFDQGTLVDPERRGGHASVCVRVGALRVGKRRDGDLGERESTENYGPLVPESTYGASKLAGEALIASYCHMFGMTGRAFRFANVVGPRRTHGVGYDFVRQLLTDPSRTRRAR